MATIKITNLAPAGSNLFVDSESYLNELTDDELGMSYGGLSPTTSYYISVAVTIVTAAGAAYAWGRWGWQRRPC